MADDVAVTTNGRRRQLLHRRRFLEPDAAIGESKRDGSNENVDGNLLDGCRHRVSRRRRRVVNRQRRRNATCRSPPATPSSASKMAAAVPRTPPPRTPPTFRLFIGRL